MRHAYASLCVACSCSFASSLLFAALPIQGRDRALLLPGGGPRAAQVGGAPAPPCDPPCDPPVNPSVTSLAAAPAPRSSKTAETRAAEKAAGKEAQQAEKQLERAQADVEKQAALA